MKGYSMKTEVYYLNESFKALLASAFNNPQQSEIFIKAFEEVVNDRATTQAIRLDRLKDEAIQEIRNELATKDLLQAELKALEAKIESKIESEVAKLKKEIVETTNNLRDELKNELATKEFVRAEIAEAKQELKLEIAEVRTEIADVRTEIAKSQTKQMWFVIYTGIASVVVIIGANFAMVKFLLETLGK